MDPAPVRRPDELKMGDLERVSGVPRSTIQQYVTLGLLPPPRRLGPKLFLYGPAHVRLLSRIRSLRDEDGLPLPEVRRRLSGSDGGGAPTPLDPDREAGATADGARVEARRAAILAAATERFARDGYEGARLDDIAAAVGVSKAALYQHFESKQALLVECIDHIRMLVVPPAERAAARRHPDLTRRGAMRARAVLERFDSFRMLTNLLVSVAYGRDASLAAKARDAFHRMVTDVLPELREAVARGLYRDADVEMHAYMLWGALMGAGDRMTRDSRYTIDQALAAYLDFVGRGTRP